MIERQERITKEITIQDEKIILESPGWKFYAFDLLEEVKKVGNEILLLQPIIEKISNQEPVSGLQVLMLSANITSGLTALMCKMAKKPLGWMDNFQLDDVAELLLACYEVIDKEEINRFFVKMKPLLTTGFLKLTPKPKPLLKKSGG